MHGITSLDGHGKASGDMNKAMERMSIVFKGRLSPEQLDQIKSDIQSTVMPSMAGEMLSAAGQGGDTMMAHMSPETIGMAQEMGVLPQGQMNPITGLPGFDVNDPTDEMGEDDPASGVGTGEGPADADLGATPAEEAAMAGFGTGTGFAGIGAAVPDAIGPQGKFSGQEKAEGWDRAFSGFMSKAQEKSAMSTGHKGYDIAAKTFGVPPSSLYGKTNKEKQDLIDRAMNARTSVNPTAAQLDLNALTERGFQQANPGITGLVGGLGTLAGFINPAFGIVNAVGNTMNTMAGRPNLVDMAFGIKAGDRSMSNPAAQAVSAPTQAAVDFVGSLMDFAGLTSQPPAAGAAPTAAPTAGSLVDAGGSPVGIASITGPEGDLVDAVAVAAADPASATDQDIDDQELGNENFVPDEGKTDAAEEETAPDQFGEKGKLLGAGDSESDAQTILDNFGSMDAFEQRFEGRFGVPPTPAQLMEADKQQFINIRRGRPVGMGTMPATTSTGNRLGGTVGSMASGIGSLMT